MTNWTNRSKWVLALVFGISVMLAVAFGVTLVFSRTSEVPSKTFDVTFAEGHGTDAKDGGRPVVLIAAALGVEPEVFREAFSGATPAKDGKPSKEAAQRNREAIMKILGPHGAAKERLDEVSDYYRYKPGKGNLWKTRPAKAHAEMENGKIKRIVVTDPGSGYSTAPNAMIPGMEKVSLKVTIEFNKDFKKNGAISSIEVE